MNNKYFFSGINGIGMSGLALIMKDFGNIVLGSDLSNKNTTKILNEHGIEVIIGQKKENIENREIDFFVYSSAIKEDHPEYICAKEKGITMIKRGELLANIMERLEKSIAVAGTHGKTTTSSMLSVGFLNKNPYIAVGGIIPEINSNSLVGKSEYFIAEADESDNSFLYMHPYYSIITNIEEDHLEYHKSLENIINSFKQFINQTKKEVIVSYDDNILRSIKDDKIRYYSIYEENKNEVDIYAKNIKVIDSKTYFSVYKKNKHICDVKLSIPGLHNVSNALAVIYILEKEKIDKKIYLKALENFVGANRRYQILLDDKVKIIDDYAHHPTEINATIDAVKLNEIKKPIYIFQPHKYSRTHFFYEEFIKAFKKVEDLILLPIYSANEENIYGISIDNMAKKIGNHVKIINDNDLIDYLLNLDIKNRVLIFMGAGSISALAHELVRRLNESIK